MGLEDFWTWHFLLNFKGHYEKYTWWAMPHLSKQMTQQRLLRGIIDKSTAAGMVNKDSFLRYTLYTWGQAELLHRVASTVQNRHRNSASAISHVLYFQNSTVELCAPHTLSFLSDRN